MCTLSMCHLRQGADVEIARAKGIDDARAGHRPAPPTGDPARFNAYMDGFASETFHAFKARMIAGALNHTEPAS